jgi:hypothetical protein
MTFNCVQKLKTLPGFCNNYLYSPDVYKPASNIENEKGCLFLRQPLFILSNGQKEENYVWKPAG